MEVNDRIRHFLKTKRITVQTFEASIKRTNGYLSHTKSPTANVIKTIAETYPEINLDWLITGNGAMLRSDEGDRDAHTRNLIPFYDDVASVGGLNDVVANTDGSPAASEWIDTGDWFTEATAAIRHYGDSMTEYPSGCILALREIVDRQLIIWGKTYVIETDEFRVTKRLQRSEKQGCVCAYSTNKETYRDGRLIHEPVDIPVDSIRHLSLVLGHVIKEQSSGMVYTRKNSIPKNNE